MRYSPPLMRPLHRAALYTGVFTAFGVASLLSLRFGSGGIWKALEPATLAAATGKKPKAPYDITKLTAVNATLKLIKDKYVDPSRVKPRDMLISALNRVQQDVAPVIVLHDEGSADITVRVGTAEKKIRVDNVQGPWDVTARLREVFGFLRDNLKDTDVDLREVEYAACNGMLYTLDPHSVFLSPEAYKDMSASTAGQFGGLGIVISVRDQLLTVMNPMPDTPAGRAGLRRLDRIVKINAESTLNMPLDDAVRRLRGEPGSKVNIWVRREGEGGWQGDKKIELTREIIQVKSVLSRVLDGNIGYLRLKQFQGRSLREVEAALAEMKQKGPLKGLVFDLRGNPGGLLDQAVKISDLFLRKGVIVATVGHAEGREEKVAKDPGTEPDYPIVVLVNGSSASASEIVAGALKNLDRALIVGTTTFGKGSVQLIFNDVTPEKAALKLTIAQYLTPGDESIQSVGIAPDIELDPVTVDAREMDLYSKPRVTRERDLSAHLSNARAREGQKPSEDLRYYMSVADREAMRERGSEVDDDFVADFPIRVARDIAARTTPGQKRAEMVRSVHDFLRELQKEELTRVSQDLSKLAIDWSDPPAATPPEGAPSAKDFEVTVDTVPPGAQVTAGDPLRLTVSVKNTGKEPVYHLRAKTQSDAGYYDGKELVFGKILPGETKSASAPMGFCETEGRKPGQTKPAEGPRVCRIPKDAVTRQDGVKVKFETDTGAAPADAELRPTIRALDRPAFAYGYQLVDNRGAANGDGRIQRGEGVTLYLAVKNVGKGRSFETQANLRNLSGDGVLLGEGRFDISNMNPGDVRHLALTFDVMTALEDPEAKVELSIADRDLREAAVEKIRIPMDGPGALTPDASGAKTKAETQLLEAPVAGARAFARLPGGTAVRVLAKADGWKKIDLGKGRFAFVADKDLEPAQPPADPPTLEEAFAKSPPLIELAAEALATREGKIKVSGVASDPDDLLDAYLFVNARKISYRSNKGAADPKKLPVDLEVPLRPGINYIRFFARETPDTVSQRLLIVRRDGANGELLPTPKSDEALFEDLAE